MLDVGKECMHPHSEEVKYWSHWCSLPTPLPYISHFSWQCVCMVCILTPVVLSPVSMLSNSCFQGNLCLILHFKLCSEGADTTLPCNQFLACICVWKKDVVLNQLRSPFEYLENVAHVSDPHYNLGCNCEKTFPIERSPISSVARIKSLRECGSEGSV